jgi:ABC-2 type transport system ATP-binding protein
MPKVPNHSTEPIIQLDHVVKRFGDVTAVADISLSVQPGELFAFLGPNGAGKSTTIKMLTALQAPTSGTVTLAGYNVAHEPDRARGAFGIVFQDTSVDNELTAYENMELHAALYGVPRAVRRTRIHELLKLLELSDRADSYVKTFSGGMIRRLEIARGLLHQPKILFLDEPTLGLDTQTRTLLWSYVTKLSREVGMTVFFTTHYLEEAEEVASRIAIIDHGKIVASGTVAELKAQTKADSLENAYLALTGTAIREEKAESNSRMRMMATRGRR